MPTPTLTITRGFFTSSTSYTIEGEITNVTVNSNGKLKFIKCGQEEANIYEGPVNFEITKQTWKRSFTGFSPGTYKAGFRIQGDENMTPVDHVFTVPNPMIPPYVTTETETSATVFWSVTDASKSGNDYTISGIGPPSTNAGVMAVNTYLIRTSDSPQSVILGENMCTGLKQVWTKTEQAFDGYNAHKFVLYTPPYTDLNHTVNF